jgi:hypothetical protein
MARDDWRLRIELEDRVDTLLERLGVDLHDEARELARELEEDRLAVSRDDDTVFVYTESGLRAEQAQRVVESVLEAEQLQTRVLRIEHWLADEDRWDDDPPGPDIDEELVSRGYAPWEVRVECASHDEADELADQLEREGFEVVRRWTYLIIGTRTRDEAAALAERVHGEVEAGGELVWEVMPRNPFALFGGLGG